MIVSGLAEGIDTAAIQVQGRTVAIIGTPLDESYPKQNTELQRYLMEHKLVLSQFPQGTRTQGQNFPIRNPTMVLICDATVIIEANQTSGSLLQGWEALRLGRPIFIARSIVDNPSLTWPSEMIGYGAYILSDETIDELFAILPQRGLAEPSSVDPF